MTAKKTKKEQKVIVFGTQPGKTFANLDFKRALLTQDMEIVSQGIDTFVNSDSGVRTFDVVLHATRSSGKNAKLAEAALQKILKNETWNPNYQGPDKWYPEDRAMLYRRDDVAIAVIRHPNFDKDRLPRVVATAQQFGSKKVLEFLGKQRVRG